MAGHPAPQLALHPGCLPQGLRRHSKGNLHPSLVGGVEAEIRRRHFPEDVDRVVECKKHVLPELSRVGREQKRSLWDAIPRRQEYMGVCNLVGHCFAYFLGAGTLLQLMPRFLNLLQELVRHVGGGVQPDAIHGILSDLKLVKLGLVVWLHFLAEGIIATLLPVLGTLSLRLKVPCVDSK